MTIAITGPTSTNETVGLTANATGCASGSNGTSCTVSIPGLISCPSSANCYAATIATYDAVTGCPSACTIPNGSNELSADQNVPFTIATGRSNQLNVTLGGIPASVTVLALDGTGGSAASGLTLTACGSSGQLEVLALDADGNIILGGGAPTPALTSNDPAHLMVSGPSAASPNAFTLSRTTLLDANGVVQLTASVTPGSSSGGSAQSSHVGITIGLCGVYVADTLNAAVKEILAVNGSIPVSPTIDTLGSGFASPAAVAVDGSGNVYVPGNSVVKEMLAVDGIVPPSPTINTLGPEFIGAIGVAVDGAGNVYAVSELYNTVEEMVTVGGSIPATPAIRTLGSGFSTPFGVAVDASGNVFVADTGNGAVKEMLAVGGSLPPSPTINTLASGLSVPEDVKVDNAGNVCVVDFGDNTVKEIVAVGGSIPPSPTIKTLGSGFNGPQGLGIDGAGNVYVADTYNNAVKEMLAVGGSVPASPTIVTLGSGFDYPEGAIGVR